MNPIQLMELHKDSFTQNDTRIYHVVLSNPELVVSSTTSKLAGECGVSQPALTRFVKSLGYERYRDFRSDLTAWLASEAKSTPREDGERLQYFTRLQETIEKTEDMLTAEYVQDLASYITSHKRIFATGMAKSYQPAELFEILMRRNKLDVHAVPHDSLSELIDFLDEDDLLIVFTVSAKEESMTGVSRACNDVLVVTANAAHAYRDVVDRTVVLPYASVDPESASVSPVLFDILVELLTEYIAREPRSGQAE